MFESEERTTVLSWGNCKHESLSKDSTECLAPQSMAQHTAIPYKTAYDSNLREVFMGKNFA